MKAFAGTGALIRLALRRDRIKLPLWILGIVGSMAANVPAVMTFYDSTEKQLTYAATTAPSVVSRVFGGPINGPHIGEIVVNETFLFTAIAIAFMSTLSIVRHTRQNEETGRAELVRSTVVGGQASLSAALIVTIGTNTLLAGLLALVFISNGLPLSGAIAVSAALGGIGVVFAGIAAITAQLSESARGANNLAAITIGIFFLNRAIGDGLGTVSQNGLAISSAWPSWLSPFGWGQQLYGFTEANWWIFGLFAVFATGLVAGAFLLSSHRDVGLGILPARRGPSTAAPQLLSPLGLAWRLQRGTMIGWAVVVLIMGMTIGIISKEFEKLFSENEQFAEFFGQVGINAPVSDILFSGMMIFMALAIAGYALQSLLKMRAEETAGHLESILAATVSRHRWLMSHLTCTLIGVISLTLLLGLSASISYVAITGSDWSNILRLTTSAIVHIPAILVLVGGVVMIFGLAPRSAVALSWIVFALCLFIIQFGTVLKLPDWVLNISPFGHTPAAPLEAITAGPLIILSASFLSLAMTGMMFFRRRDLITS